MSMKNVEPYKDLTTARQIKRRIAKLEQQLWEVVLTSTQQWIRGDIEILRRKLADLPDPSK